ncbi:MAG: HAMP domain-containing sensor histidine kinase [Desulfovibrionaceae bacterium]|nr:HAMP domain-containing sensor histidine kinase [Desulfovibrionaceae bacterium]
MVPREHGESARPLQFVKVLSWLFLLLIIGSSLGLSVLISNYAERTLLAKQKQFSLLLAENLSHQIYTRFAWPTIVGYGKISLKNKEQFARLDQVVRSTIHSFHVVDVRIYDLEAKVSYSTDAENQGKSGLAGSEFRRALEKNEPAFELASSMSWFRALFQFSLRPGSMVLKATYPLRAERIPGAGIENPLMGILEFTQDITEDYMAVINFERLVVGSSLLTSLILFFVIMTILRRADRLNLQRLREKERLERELLEQEKLAGMGRVVAGVAHEIRNPLGIIQSSSELVLKKLRAEHSPHARLLEAIHEEAKRLSRTVNDFLDYARPKKPGQDDVDLGRVLDQLAVFLKTECEKRGVVLVSEISPGAVVKGDKDLLYRAFYNVVSNAIQALDGPGEIRLWAAPDQDGVRVSVTDTGPGFPREHMDNIKDPFFTTRDTGTGLGLAIVGSILESHGASLSLSNAEGGGARAEIFFPAT